MFDTKITNTVDIIKNMYFSIDFLELQAGILKMCVNIAYSNFGYYEL